jgi:hypothetical protein
VNKENAVEVIEMLVEMKNQLNSLFTYDIVDNIDNYYLNGPVVT